LSQSLYKMAKTGKLICVWKQPIDDGQPPEEELDASAYYLTGPKLYLCALSIVFCLILSAMDQTIANTAIKGLESTFHDFSKIGWVTSLDLVSQVPFDRVDCLLLLTPVGFD
jgi:hypothetical protein